MQAKYSATTQEFKQKLETIILCIVAKYGKVYLCDLCDLIRLSLHGIESNWLPYSDHAIACVWELEKEQLKRVIKNGCHYIELAEV